jgi:aspartate-alanine antiporter
MALLDWLQQLFGSVPELALFVSLFLGYLIGRIKFGTISLGGIAGTLIVAIVIGQLGVTISDDTKNIAFAIFIFALGFTAGPQFFAHLNRAGLKLGVFTLIEAVVIVSLILLWTGLLGLDPGTASGLLAGSATESAVIGTATDAIGGLPESAATISEWQANVATAYSLSYLFGLITIVLFTSQFAEMLLRVNLKEMAAEMWKRMGGDRTLPPGEAPATPRVTGRIHEVTTAVGQTVEAVEALLSNRVTVERIRRDSTVLEADNAQVLRQGDLVLIIGARTHLLECDTIIGPERDYLDSLQFSVESRDIWLTNARVSGKTIAELYAEADPEQSRGVYLGGLTRGEVSLPPLPETRVEPGDVLTLTGSRRDLDRVTKLLGRTVPKSTATDFVYLGLGAALGILIGQITIELGGVPISLGTGGGCLLTGLVFGWYHSRRPTIGNYPPAAAQFAKDIGLAIFIAATGLSVGPQATALISEYGILLPLAGVLNVLIPASVSLFVGYRLLKVESPVLVGAIAGQQCSTPAGTAAVDKVGNTVPMLGYTVTYALSNVLLPLLGPLGVLLTYWFQ